MIDILHDNSVEFINCPPLAHRFYILFYIPYECILMAHFGCLTPTRNPLQVEIQPYDESTINTEQIRFR